MVYCGKPSRGCQMCRTRRIKCDETKPTCNQCAKSRRRCPGYKDEFDLIFRNETQATERRAQKANKKAIALKANRQLHDEDQAVVPSLRIPVEQQASCHFAANFIMPSRDGRNTGYFDFIFPLLGQERPDSHIQHAFNACSLAFLDNRGGQGSRLSEAALREYSVALAKTNIALRCAETQTSDATLASVVLLGMFENVSAKQISSFNWGSHVEGAVQLVKLRGKQQVQSKIGLQLFVAVRRIMTISCLTAGHYPIMGSNWWLGEADCDDTSSISQGFMIRTSEIRAEISDVMTYITRTPENIELILEHIRRAQMLDQEVEAWLHNLPEEWRYRTIAWEDNVVNGDYARAEVFPGRVDVFNDVSHAYGTNAARTVRLILASIIVRCTAWVCSPVDYRTTPEYATAASTCRDTITDIIASVPYHFGWHLKRKGNWQDASLGTFVCGEETPAKGVGGYLLTWPLACLLTQDYTTDAQRAWVIGRLQRVSSELGMKHAAVLSHLQVRIPSTLIRRDGIAAQPSHGPQNSFHKVLMAALTPPPASHVLTPHGQWEDPNNVKTERGLPNPNKAELGIPR
ncbi:hypothetical protein F5Y16DRAFT_414206 [Xylariaceae sp. FL0255]|nr:hypothetical protein F5Y16DRAFT_414206 [Xylariaceae sp. FL0255]